MPELSFPALPVEIWQIILRSVAVDLRYIESRWDYPLGVAVWSGWPTFTPSLSQQYESGPALYEYRQNLAIKAAIVQVCRDWREMGAELFYEHIELKHSNGAQKISALKSIFEASERGGDCGYGQWVRRIDIPSLLIRSPRRVQEFIHLLSHIANLRILIIHPEGASDYAGLAQLFHALQSRFAHSLRRLEFDVHRSLGPFSRPLAIPNIPLDSLSLTLERGSIRFALEQAPFLTSSITSLKLQLHTLLEKELGPDWKFPALRYLSISKLADNDIPLLRPFMEYHAPRLISLHLNPVQHCPRINQLFDHAIPLQSLALEQSRLLTLAQQISVNSLPNLTHIAVWGGRIKPLAWNSILSPSDSAFKFPALRCVRVMNMEYVATQDIPVELQELGRDTWVQTMRNCQGLGIRLEDRHAFSIEVNTEVR